MSGSSAWKIALADFMTTLMILFLILWVLNTATDAGKKGLMDYFSGKVDKKKYNQAQKTKERHKKKSQNLSKLIKDIKESMQSSKDISVKKMGGRVLVTLSSGSLFESAKATIKPDFKDKIVSLIKLINQQAVYVDIYGYTDNLPISYGYYYQDNLDLSLARAQSVAALMIKNKVDDSDIGVHGMGERDPISDNKTTEGRAKNRRVSIYITPYKNLKSQNANPHTSTE